MKWSKYENSYIFDIPIEYKGLVFYPGLVKDYIPVFYFSDCLTMDKNSIPDVKIISMTYLDYMYSESTKDKPYLSFFDALLRIILRKPNMVSRYYRNNGRSYFEIDGQEYNSTDFDEIKKIITEYNCIDVPDEMIQKEIRDADKKAKEMRSRNSGKMASLEDQIVCVLISSGLSLEEISNLSIRKFIKILERADAKLHYEIYLSASLSGMVEFKDKSFIKHWLSDINKDEIELVPLTQIEGTVSGQNFRVRNK
jgi:hypothetical protein